MDIERESSGADQDSATVEDHPQIDRDDLYTEIEALNGTIEDLEGKMRDLQRQLAHKEQTLIEFKREAEGSTDSVSRLKAERRQLESEKTNLVSMLQNETHKNTMLLQNRIKSEQTIAELEESLLSEKRQLNVVVKNNRKFELEIQSAENERDDYERRIKELESRLKHKDENINSLKDVVEEKAAGHCTIMRKLSDLQSDYDELEQRLENEKELRVKAERRNTENELEIRELDETLQENQRVNSSNADLTRRREGELEKLRFDMRELSEIHETTVSQLKQKHQTAVEEMGRQIDEIYSEKGKLDKSVHELSYKLVHVEGEVEKLEKEKENMSVLNAQLDSNLEEANKHVEDLAHKCDEQIALKKKSEGELKHLSGEVEEYRNQVSSLLKAKQSLQDHVEIARHHLDEENRARVVVTAELRNAMVELDSVKTQLEDELETRCELEKELITCTNLAEHLRKKYENERFERMREIEELRSKLESRLSEAEDQLEQSANKSLLLQRSREKLQQEVEDMVGAIDKANTTIANLERRHKRFDRLIDEWKQKCENISMELAAAQNNSKYMSSEAQKKQDQYLEAQDHIESLRRENRNLSDEVKTLMEQMEDDATSAFEFEKAKQKLEKEKEELRSKIDDCMMEKEESDLRVQSVMNDLDSARREYEMAMNELQEDIEASKRNSQQIMQMMEENLAGEIAAKREAIAQKDQALASADNLRGELCLASDRVMELKTQIDGLMEQLDELRCHVEDEKQHAQAAREAEAAANKRNRYLVAEIEHAKENLLNSERAADTLKVDLNSANNAKNELSVHNHSLSTQKSYLESALAKLQLDHEANVSEIRVLEERCSKVSSENAKLTEKMNMDRNQIAELDNQISQLRIQLTEAENRAEMAESNAFRSFKTTIQALEDSLLERDNDVQILSHKIDEAQRNTARSERKLRDVLNQSEVVSGQNEKLHDLNESLQQKMKNYRKQADQAEQEAAQCLARYKVMNDDLSRAEQRADAAEQMMNKYRAASRFSYITAKPNLSMESQHEDLIARFKDEQKKIMEKMIQIKQETALYKAQMKLDSCDSVNPDIIKIENHVEEVKRNQFAVDERRARILRCLENLSDDPLGSTSMDFDEDCDVRELVEALSSIKRRENELNDMQKSLNEEILVVSMEKQRLEENYRSKCLELESLKGKLSSEQEDEQSKINQLELLENELRKAKQEGLRLSDVLEDGIHRLQAESDKQSQLKSQKEERLLELESNCKRIQSENERLRNEITKEKITQSDLKDRLERQREGHVSLKICSFEYEMEKKSIELSDEVKQHYQKKMEQVRNKIEQMKEANSLARIEESVLKKRNLRNSLDFIADIFDGEKTTLPVYRKKDKEREQYQGQLQLSIELMRRRKHKLEHRLKDLINVWDTMENA